MNREAKQLPVNPKYKDTFFWMLFREKEELMKQYMQYVERVRNYARAQGMSLDEAVSMCIFEYDEEKEMETTVEEFRRMIDCQNSGSAAAPAEH